MDDHIASGVEAIDVMFDGLFARFDLTRPLVDLVDANVITKAGRMVALLWELAIDFLIGRQVFAFERKAFERGRLKKVLKHIKQEARRARALGSQSLIVFLRPALAAVFVLTGASAVARAVQGAVTLTLHIGFIARLLALAALAGCIAVLGVDSVAAAFGRARDERMNEPIMPRSVRRELIVTAVALPLVYLALFEAFALTVFFR